MEQIRHDESALDALAYAYGELSAPERRGLMHAAVQDALDPTRALGAFLAVESDPTLANRLAVLIGKHGGPGRLATIDGEGGRGEACLIQPLHGLTAERMRIAWNQNKIEGIEIEPRIDMKSVSQGPFVAVARAVDTLAPLIWRHVRSGGELPQGVERFAGFFSLE